MRKKAVTKDSIIEMAAEIIEEKGTAQCNMREIAARLGIAVGTLYNYYNSRNLLLNDLFHQSWNKTFQSLEIIQNAEISFEEKIKKLVFVITDDINKRGGLGLELMKTQDKDLDFKKSQKFVDVGNHIVEIITNIYKIENQVKKLGYSDEELLILSRWLYAIVNDSLLRKKEFTDTQFELLFKVLK